MNSNDYRRQIVLYSMANEKGINAEFDIYQLYYNLIIKNEINIKMYSISNILDDYRQRGL